MNFEVVWAMPNKWTFTIKPIREFVIKHIRGCDTIVDPFCGKSDFGTHRNDLANSGIDAEEFVRQLIASGVNADAVIFDPPYSPRQISECYKSIGKKPTMEDTQNSRLYSRVRKALDEILRPNGVALSFGWQSSGFGKKYFTDDILLVQHGGAHNDTICVKQRKLFLE